MPLTIGNLTLSDEQLKNPRIKKLALEAQAAEAEAGVAKIKATSPALAVFGEGAPPTPVTFKEVTKEVPEAAKEVTKELGKDVFIKAPTKVAVSLAELGFTAQDQNSLVRQASNYLREKTSIEPVTTFAEDVVRRIDEEKMPSWLAILMTGSEAIIDTVITADVIRLGAAGVKAGIPMPRASQQAAWEALGRPATMDEAKQTYRALAHRFHPDIGGTQAKFEVINNAYSVLRNQGIPTQPAPFAVFIREAAEALGKPLSELGKPSKLTEPFLGEPLALPGTRIIGKPRPAFGLSTEEVEPVTAKPTLGKPKTAAYKGLPRNPREEKSFEKAKDWLSDYQNIDTGPVAETGIKPPSEEVLDYLSNFRPANPIRLYRGVRPNQALKESVGGIESWTHKKSTAQNFAEGGKVIERVIDPEDIIFDTKSMPVNTRKEFISGVDSGMAEQEVLVKFRKTLAEPLEEQALKQQNVLRLSKKNQWQYRDEKGVFTVAPSKAEAIKRANEALVGAKTILAPKAPLEADLGVKPTIKTEVPTIAEEVVGKLEAELTPQELAEAGFAAQSEYDQAIKEIGDLAESGHRDLIAEVKQKGGIRFPVIREEDEVIPRSLRSKSPDAMTLDEMAEATGMGSDEELRLALEKQAGGQFATLKKLKIDKKAEFISKIDKELKKAKRMEVKNEAERTKVLKDIGREVIKEITKKRFSLAQKLKAEARAEVRGVKVGVKLGRKEARQEIISKLRETQQDIRGVKDQIIDYAKEHLATKDRGRALVLLRDAKTPKNLAKAFSRINRWAEDIEKRDIVKRVLKAKKRALESPSVAVDYKDKIKAAIEGFELKGHTSETMRRLVETQKFIDGALARGEDVEMPKRILGALRILARKPLADITLRELDGVEAELGILEDLGRLKWKTKVELYEMEKGKIKQELLKESVPLQTREIFKPQPGEKLTSGQKFRNYALNAMNKANQIDKVISPMDVVFDVLDGSVGTYDGANSRLIKRRLDTKFGAYLDLKDSIQNKTLELAEKHNLTEPNYRRMGVVAAREQEGGVEKLKNLGFTDEQIDGIKLTDAEQETLDLMRTTQDEQFPFVQQIMKDIYNQDVKKVKNYFSFMTDWKAMDEAEVFQRLGPNVEEFGKPTKNVELGFTKERTGAGKQKIQINAMRIFLNHTDNVAYLRSMARDIKMLSEIVNSPEYGAAGDMGQVIVQQWLDLMARKGGTKGANQIAAIDWLRRNASAGILGLKISSAAIQWTTLIDGMGMIGPEWGMKGAYAISTDGAWREFVTKFPELRERIGGELAIRELVDGTWLEKLQRKGFIPLQKIDGIAASMIAVGSYQKRMAELGRAIDLTKDPDLEAMDYAQLVMRRTQGSSQFKDVPLALSRGSMTENRSIDRAFFQFQTFMLYRWSRVRHDAVRVGIRTKDPKHAINVMFWLTIASLAATGTRMGIYKLEDWVFGKKEDEDDNRFWRSMLQESIGMVPFLNNITAMWMYDAEFAPVVEMPKDIVDPLKRAVQAKKPETRIRAEADFVASTMKLFGVPGAAELKRQLKNILPKAPAGKPSANPLLKGVGGGRATNPLLKKSGNPLLKGL